MPSRSTPGQQRQTQRLLRDLCEPCGEFERHLAEQVKESLAASGSINFLLDPDHDITALAANLLKTGFQVQVLKSAALGCMKKQPWVHWDAAMHLDL